MDINYTKRNVSTGNKPTLLVVPIIDTEGPTTGRGDMCESWDSLARAIQELHGRVRERLRDSSGAPARISWFLLDWAGFSPDDSEFLRRGHDSRMHAVWDFYNTGILSDALRAQTGDGRYWHYHHPPKDGSWGWNRDWNDSSWHEYILGKNILDLGFFPAVYRAGKYVQTNQSSEWLEQWIPFDFSNVSPVSREFCDWSAAPVDWTPYHPSRENYQIPGAMKRLVARSLPVAAKGGSGALNFHEVEAAFSEAAKKGKAIFSFHTHDYYKSAADEFESAYEMICRAAQSWGVSWQWAPALDAFRRWVMRIDQPLELTIELCDREVMIRANHDLFGSRPFVVAEMNDGAVRRIDAVPVAPDQWLAAIPDKAVRVGAGAADAFGFSAAAAFRHGRTG